MEPDLTPADLERIALTALKAARALMETGSRAKTVHACSKQVAEGLGATYYGSRTGYASLALTVETKGTTLTRMIAVGGHGVNQRLNLAIKDLATKTTKGTLSVEETEAELHRLLKETPRHAPLTVAFWVGLACASFGRLLGMDWTAFLPVFLAGSVGQYGRHLFLKHGLNVFVNAALIAFLASLIGGFGAKLAGSDTTSLAMMAATLLLVPGVPATNAQADVMDGYPTMGSARAVAVLMIMVFVTTGIWASQSLMGLRP